MDVLDAVIIEIDEKVGQLRDFLAIGRVGSYEEYKQLCGEIKGLLFAREYAKDLKKRMENSDDE